MRRAPPRQWCHPLDFALTISQFDIRFFKIDFWFGGRLLFLNKSSQSLFHFISTTLTPTKKKRHNDNFFIQWKSVEFCIDMHRFAWFQLWGKMNLIVTKQFHIVALIGITMQKPGFLLLLNLNTLRRSLGIPMHRQKCIFLVHSFGDSFLCSQTWQFYTLKANCLERFDQKRKLLCTVLREEIFSIFPPKLCSTQAE